MAALGRAGNIRTKAGAGCARKRGEKKGRRPSPATVMRMLREHDEKTGVTS